MPQETAPNIAQPIQCDVTSQAMKFPKLPEAVVVVCRSDDG